MKLTTTKIGLILFICLLPFLGYLYPSAQSKIFDSESSAPNTESIQAIALQPTQDKPLKSARVTPIDCRNTLLPNENKTVWQESQKTYLKTQLINLEQQGIDENILDKVAIETGIGLFKGRHLRHGNPDDLKKPIYYEGEVFFAKPKIYMTLRKQLEAGEFAEIIKSVKAGSFDPNVYYLGDTKMAFLLSFILDFANDDKAALIDELIDNGINVTYSDLAIVTHLNIPEATVNRLYLSSDLQADKRLNKFGRYTSLALLAIHANDAQLASYWISMGSPLQPDLFYDNGLDLLAKSGDGFSQAALDSLFEQIILKGISPYWPSTYQKLRAKISPTLFNQYKDRLIEIPEPLQPLLPSQLKEAQSLVQQIHTKLLDGAVNFELGTKPKHQCFTQLGRRLTKFAMRYKPRKKPVKHKPEVDTSEKVDKITIAERLAKAKNLFSKDQDIEAYLAQEQALENKQAIESLRRQQVAELAQAVRQQFETAPLTQETRVAMAEIVRLANAGKWQEAVSLLGQLEIPSEEAMTTLLVLALNSNADFVIIKQLLDKGGKLIPNAISGLIARDNVELAKQLLPFGLDIHYVERGYSTLAISVENRALKMLKFLIKQGVEMDSDSYGFDALDIALNQFNIKTTGLTYVSILLEAGARVEMSHKQIVDTMKINNMEAYFALTNAHHQLKL